MNGPALFPAPLMTINGVAVHSTRCSPVVDPSTGKAFASCPEASEGQIDHAVEAANRAFADWSKTPLEDRRRALLEYGQRINDNSDKLAALLTREQGKPLAKSRSEIAAALAYLQAFTKINLPVETIRDTAAQRVELHRQPLGAIGAITAWNYPILLAVWKLAPALVAGNTIVLKPSPYTPLTTLRLGELTQELLPPGVMNVIAGGNEAGEQLTRHPGLRKITFTGSGSTGRRIMASAASNLKRLTLELGGNDVGIVLDDVDAPKIANDLFWAKFSNCGQVCAALKRLYVHERAYPSVCDALVAKARTVKVGDGFDPSSEIGPIQNRMQYEKIDSMVSEAVKDGATVLFQGNVPDRGGYFFPVTLLANVREGMRVVDEEAFGPVLPIMTFRDEDEVLERANGTEYGLGGSVWSSNIERATSLARRLVCGSAWVNQHPAMDPETPFGGVKGSGIGVEGAKWGLEEYTTLQVLNIRQA